MNLPDLGTKQSSWKVGVASDDGGDDFDDEQEAEPPSEVEDHVEIANESVAAR